MSCVIFPRFIGPIFIDVVISESATASMEIPTHPVERGAKISDHAWRLPTTIQMECVSQDIMGSWRALTDLMAEAEPFDLVTGFDMHESMMIESITPRRDVVTSQLLSFEITLKEIILVSTGSGGNAGRGGDQRGLGLFDRGPVQSLLTDVTSGRGLSVGASLGIGPFRASASLGAGGISAGIGL